MEIKMFEAVSVNGAEVNPVKMFRDYFFNYVMENKLNNRKNFSYDNTVTFEAKQAEMDKILKCCIEQAVGQKKPDLLSFEAWVTSPTVEHMAFSIVAAMVESVLPDTLDDSIGLYTDIRYAGYGDSLSFDVKPRDLFTVSQSGRGTRTAFIQKQFSTTKTLNPINHQVTVGVSLYKVLSGKESLAEFTVKAIRAIESQVTYEAYDALSAAVNSGTFPAALKLTSWSQDQAVALAQKVTAWNGGNKAMFVGTQNALNKILPANANYRYMLDSEYVKIGYVKEFGDYQTIVLPQIADYTSDNFGLKLDDTKVYVISATADKLVKLGIEGSLLTVADKYDSNANLEQNVTFNKSFAAEVITSAIAGVITVA